MIDAVQSFSAMLRETLGERLNPGAETFVQMFAQDGVMEFPYALPSPRRLEGREALAAHLAYLARLVELLSVSDVARALADDAAAVRQRATDDSLSVRGRGSRSGLYTLLVDHLSDPEPLVVVGAAWFLSERRVVAAVPSLVGVATAGRRLRRVRSPGNRKW